MTRVLLTTTLAVALFELCALGTAYAQGEPTPEARRRAARLTEQAETDYRAERFESASVSYQRAYAIVPEPALLFNIGQCHRLLGRPERALHFFRAYLRLQPDAPQRALVEELIAESNQRVAHTNAEPTGPDRVARIPTPLSHTYAQSERDDRSSPAIYETWWFWTGVGLLTAGAATALAVGLDGPEASTPRSSLGNVRWE